MIKQNFYDLAKANMERKQIQSSKCIFVEGGEIHLGFIQVKVKWNKYSDLTQGN